MGMRKMNVLRVSLLATITVLLLSSGGAAQTVKESNDAPKLLPGISTAAAAQPAVRFVQLPENSLPGNSLPANPLPGISLSHHLATGEVHSVSVVWAYVGERKVCVKN